MSSEAHIALFLQALDRQFRPMQSQRHCIFVDDEGFLCVHVATRPPQTSVVLQDGDLAKPVDTLIAEFSELLARLAAVKRGAAEFNASRGGR